ncbi:MAG: outer membrane protein assembly factor BamC [Betaproteobacteria bacterium]|nr:outer membrane protein assembly factor BamC [Betaproteobacteria bacterium]
MTRIRTLAFVLAPLVLASGCGIFKTEQQQREARTRERPLEVPPDLTTPAVDERFAVPDPKASTSYSQYNKDRAGAPQGTPAARAATPSGVLPAVPNARIEREGNQRWIVAKAEPAEVWPIVRAFWQDMGFSIARESVEAAFLETNWQETRPKIETTGIRGVMERVLPGMYSTGERDRFRTRLERGLEPGTTEIYVSHRGLEEVYPSQMQDTTVWQPRGTGSDRDLEGEMLARLLLKLADPAKPVAPASPGKPGTVPSVVTAATIIAPNATVQNNGAGPLVVNDGFDRAWRRVGLALDRTGFTVEDRDRSKGTYFVRYFDPDAAGATSNEGFLDKLAFWRPAAKPALPQYRVQVTESNSTSSQVVVQNAKGEAEASPTSKRILALLLEQLK